VRNGPTALQLRLTALLREARWMLFAALAAWLALVLATWHPQDPAWSHAAADQVVHNRGGALGAYLSDILYYLFGFSAWWWVVLLLHRVWAGYAHLAGHRRDLTDKSAQSAEPSLPRVHWEQGVGFVLVLLAQRRLLAGFGRLCDGAV